MIEDWFFDNSFNIMIAIFVIAIFALIISTNGQYEERQLCLENDMPEHRIYRHGNVCVGTIDGNTVVVPIEELQE